MKRLFVFALISAISITAYAIDMQVKYDHHPFFKEAPDESSTAWGQFGALATKYLGFPEEHLLVPPINQNESKAELLLQHIFSTGNFGQYSKEKRDSKSRYLKRKWHNFRFQMSRLFKLYRILPDYTLNFGCGWLTNAIYRFFRNK